MKAPGVGEGVDAGSLELIVCGSRALADRDVVEIESAEKMKGVDKWKLEEG